MPHMSVTGGDEAPDGKNRRPIMITLRTQLEMALAGAGRVLRQFRDRMLGKPGAQRRSMNG
jgi:hypothetical protein